MEYAYAALLLNRTGEELNETNLTAVLNAANCDVVESRVKALVAAFEGVDLDDVEDVGGTAPAVPAESGDGAPDLESGSNGEPPGDASDGDEPGSDGDSPTGG